MTTPIFDFIKKYSESDMARFHMPGHKGKSTLLGIEAYDITEIDGADELYEAEGIIAESERNAGELFGADTFYSAEGSSLSIRAMIFLILKWARIHDREPFVLAARNVHKTFINASSILDIRTEWIFGREEDSYEVCRFSALELDELLKIYAGKNDLPVAVYITSPDYLGNIADIKGCAEACHKYGVFLLVDDAHGAYRKFLKPSGHPIDLGADMCADSAHKTLPVLTGGAYLHISKNTDSFFKANARQALAMFGSTSPSYLIMASLDLANQYMETMGEELIKMAGGLDELKRHLSDGGYTLTGDEPLKLTIETLPYGYDGNEFAHILRNKNIMVEYHDAAHVVFMFTTCNTFEEIEMLEKTLDSIPRRDEIKGMNQQKSAVRPVKVISSKEAILSESEELPSEQCIGRVLAQPVVSCPPAVPVYMSGERIDSLVISQDKLTVIKEKTSKK